MRKVVFPKLKIFNQGWKILKEKLKARQERVIGTIIGKETEFRGDLNSRESLHIEGRYEGRISIQGDLFVGESGRLQAEVEAKNISIAGELKGNAKAKNKLELSARGKIYGDIKAANLFLFEGAVLKGRSEVGEIKE
ncbi:MAG: cell shape determination protein CcmA [Armatimonadetes bacterium CG07_land_8_20_14_0_80_40_9]|nr:MAG: cell shape determination protein CcmA [Armatimonadetes bacterium CG07_land_8_20_14_0_80_40_9]